MQSYPLQVSELYEDEQSKAWRDIARKAVKALTPDNATGPRSDE